MRPGAIVWYEPNQKMICPVYYNNSPAAYWQEFKPMAENIINSSDSYQSIGITDKVIEYNTWLAEARTSQEIWGNWSMYFNVDLSGLEYIIVGGK